MIAPVRSDLCAFIPTRPQSDQGILRTLVKNLDQLERTQDEGDRTALLVRTQENIARYWRMRGVVMPQDHAAAQALYD